MRVLVFRFHEHLLTFILSEEISILTLIEALNDKIQGDYQSKNEQFPIDTIDFTKFKETFKESLESKDDFDWMLNQLESYISDENPFIGIMDLEGQILPK